MVAFSWESLPSVKMDTILHFPEEILRSRPAQNRFEKQIATKIMVIHVAL